MVCVDAVHGDRYEHDEAERSVCLAQAEFARERTELVDELAEVGVAWGAQVGDAHQRIELTEVPGRENATGFDHALGCGEELVHGCSQSTALTRNYPNRARMTPQERVTAAARRTQASGPAARTAASTRRRMLEFLALLPHGPGFGG